MQLSLTPYTSKFKPAVLQLNHLALKKASQNWKRWHKTQGKDWYKRWDDDLSAIDSVYQQGGEFLLLLDKDKLVGMGGILKIDESCAKVKRIRVHPNYQGQGLSGWIIVELEKKAMQLGYKKLISDIVNGNSPAEKMLLKAGFGNPQNIYFEGVECTLFEKKLE